MCATVSGFAIQVPWIKFRSSGLCNKHVYPLNHLVCVLTMVFTLNRTSPSPHLYWISYFFHLNDSYYLIMLIMLNIKASLLENLLCLKVFFFYSKAFHQVAVAHWVRHARSQKTISSCSDLNITITILWMRGMTPRVNYHPPHFRATAFGTSRARVMNLGLAV